MTAEETIEIMDKWSLQEAVRINRDVLGSITAGWERAKSPTGRDGFRGVIRKGRKVIWRSESVSIHSSPSDAWEDAHHEQEHRVFAAWKAEKGLK